MLSAMRREKSEASDRRYTGDSYGLPLPEHSARLGQGSALSGLETDASANGKVSETKTTGRFLPSTSHALAVNVTSEGDGIAAAGDDGSWDDGSWHGVVPELAETLWYAPDCGRGGDSARWRGLLVVSQQVTIHKHFLQ